MHLALEKGERVTMGGKRRREIRGEAGEVTGVVEDAPTTDGLGKKYGTFSGWGMAAGKVEVLLQFLAREREIVRERERARGMYIKFLCPITIYILFQS